MLPQIALLAREFKLTSVSAGRQLPYLSDSDQCRRFRLTAFFLFKLLEEAAVGLYHGKSVRESISTIGAGSWRRLICIATIFFLRDVHTVLRIH